MSDNKEYAWVVAGGIMQVPLIVEFQSRGYKVIVSDRNPDAPGCQIADEVIGIDTYDIGMHLTIAEKMKIRPSAVATIGADVGPTVSTIAEFFGLPAEKTSVASRCRNKTEMRNTLKASHPVFMTVRDTDMIHTIWQGKCIFNGVKAYPCVLKPSELSGSRGISIVESPFQWPAAIEKARKAAGPRSTLIVEEFLDGDEIAVDFFVRDGKLILANSAYRMFHKFGIEAGHINPYHPSDEIIQIAQNAAEKLGVTTGPFKADFICDKRYGPTLVECATRLGGGFDSMKTATIATGRDLVSAMAHYAITGKVKKTNLRIKKNKFACAYSPILPPGQVMFWKTPKIDIDWLCEIIIVSADEIKPLDDCTARPLFIIAEGDSAYQAYRRAKTVAKDIEVTYENGKAVLAR